MIKTVVASLIPRVKKFYFPILVVAAPLLLVQIAFWSIKPEFGSEQQLLAFGLSLLDMILLEIVLMLVAYRLKTLLQGDTRMSESYWWLSINFFDVLKVIIKRVLIVGLASLLIIPGIVYAVKWFTVSPVYVFEQTADPFTRSEMLAKKRFFPLLFLFLSYWMICYAPAVFIFWKVADPELRKTVLFIPTTILWVALLPIRGLMEYEAYDYLKSNFQESYDDRYLLKTV